MDTTATNYRSMTTPQPGKGRMEPEPNPSMKGGAAAPAGSEDFTALEFEAAEQLIHLSESSGSSGTQGALPVAGAPSGVSSSSLPSVKAPPVPPAPGDVIPGSLVDWEEDEDHEVAGHQRRVKRYRLISEIYAAMEEIGGCGGSSRKNKKK